MVYADFSFYQTEYFGNVITDALDFQRLSLRASEFLDYFTQGRAKKNADLRGLKMACCAVAEQMAAVEKNASASLAGGEKQSETVGSYSVTYRSSTEVLQIAKTEMASAASRYLSGTGLLYRGGCRNVCTAHCDCL